MKKLIRNQAIRYVFFGGCTTMVNLVSYYLMRTVLGIDITVANTAAVFLSILFAYVVNKLFVFEHRTSSVWELLKEAGSFIGMRLGTMVIEVFGVVLPSAIWGVNDMAAKIAMQFIILVLNYLISRFVVFKTEDDRVTDEAQRSRRRRSRGYFLAGFSLTALVALIGFICLGIWPFGDKTLLIIDSIHQYLPFYTDFHEKMVNSESLLYSFSGGLGYNFWSTYAYYMSSPLNFLIAFVPKQNVCDFMDLMILLKIGLCGGIFSWYLHKRDESRVCLPVVFGMLFGLSNFVLGYYFNLMWLDSVAVLPLIMMGIERITEGKSGRLFGLSLFYGIWCSYYIGFMLCLFSCLYFLVRWISQKEITWKKIGRSCLAFGWYALLAGGMAALVLVPAYLGLSASQSMEGNSFPSAIQFYTDAKQLFESHLLFTTPINIANTQVGLNAYCGVATVLLAVLYLFDRKIRLRERLAHYGLCAFLLLSFSVNILNYIWHGFHVQNGLPNRFAFLYIAVLLVMAYDALGHLRTCTYRFWKLLAAWAVPAAFVAYSFWKLEPQTDAFPWYLTFGVLLLYFGLLLLGSYAFQKRSLFSALLSAVVIIEVSANAIYGISQNGGVTRSIYLADQTSYQKLMKTQEDDSFFRSEVDRQRMRNVTMFAGGRSMVMFNSTMYSSVTDFFDSVGVEARMNKNGYLGVTKLLNDVLGIKYLASPSKVADTMYQFERLGEDGELALYKNDNALSLGFMVNDAIANWDITASEPLAVQNSFVQLATGHEPIFVLDRNIIMEDGQNYGIRIPEGKQVYLCIDTRVKNINLNTPEYSRSFDDYTDHLYVINGSDENDMADFTVTLKDGQENVTAHVYTCADSAYQEVVNALAKNPLTDVTADGNYVSGRLHADWDGTLLLTVPYDEGWKITVDGTQVEQFRIGEALTGIHVGAGDHEIEMKYTPPGLWIGSILSLLCAALYLLSGILEKKYGWYTESSTEAERREEMLTEKAPEETEPKAVRSENAVSKARVLEETMPKKTVSETADQEK